MLEMQQLTGLMSHATFEHVAAVVLSTRGAEDLRTVNPALSLDQCDQLLSAIAALHLATGRLTQLNRCYAGVTDLLHRLDGFVVTAFREAWGAAAHVATATCAGVDQVPVTPQMLRFVLETAGFDMALAQTRMLALCTSCVQLAKLVHSSGATDGSESPVLVASLLLHVSRFECAAAEHIVVSTPSRVRELVDLSKRRCCVRGATVVPWGVLEAHQRAAHRAVAASSGDAAAAGNPALASHATASDFSRSALRMVELGASYTAKCLLARRSYMHAVSPDHRGGQGGASSTQAYAYDPRMLVFEAMCGFLLRGRQVELVNSFVSSARDGRSCVQQMLMGAGKTTVVGPLLVRWSTT